MSKVLQGYIQASNHVLFFRVLLLFFISNYMAVEVPTKGCVGSFKVITAL